MDSSFPLPVQLEIILPYTLRLSPILVYHGLLLGVTEQCLSMEKALHCSPVLFWLI